MQPRVALALCLLLPASAFAVAVGGAPPGAPAAAPPNPCVGTMVDPPDGTTLVSIQGTRITPDGAEKKPALLVAFGPRGRVEWVHNASAHGRWWAYDVDPLPNGTLLFATTEPGISVVEELDPGRGHVWVRRLEGVTDAHDVDLIDGDELLIADKGQGHERVLVYNLTREEVVWQWRFADHYPDSVGGPPDDWTHVNDVDEIGEGRYLVSVRNFDQVIVLDRSTGAVELTLGADDDHGILNEQHNPQYLEGANGTPTILVADSENDRVVEYARANGTWERTWELVGGGLDEPRDADRLPNGNTLVVDRRGHRTLEVTPRGRVVWEVYTPWEPYDAERPAIGDEPGGPTARELDATGTHALVGSADFTEREIETCAAALARRGRDGGNDLLGGVGGVGGREGKSVNATDPAATTAGDDERHGGIGLAGVAIAAGALSVLAVGALGAAYRRHRRR